MLTGNSSGCVRTTMSPPASSDDIRDCERASGDGLSDALRGVESAVARRVHVADCAVDVDGNATEFALDDVGGDAAPVARDLGVGRRRCSRVAGVVDEGGDRHAGGRVEPHDRQRLVGIGPAAAIADDAAERRGRGRCGGRLHRGDRARPDRARRSIGDVRLVRRPDAAPQPLQVGAGVAVRAGDENALGRQLRQARCMLADGGEQRAARTDEIERGERERRRAVAEREDAALRFVVDAGGAALTVAAEATEVHARRADRSVVARSRRARRRRAAPSLQRAEVIASMTSAGVSQSTRPSAAP